MPPKRRLQEPSAPAASSPSPRRGRPPTAASSATSSGGSHSPSARKTTPTPTRRASKSARGAASSTPPPAAAAASSSSPSFSSSPSVRRRSGAVSRDGGASQDEVEEARGASAAAQKKKKQQRGVVEEAYDSESESEDGRAPGASSNSNSNSNSDDDVPQLTPNSDGDHEAGGSESGEFVQDEILWGDDGAADESDVILFPNAAELRTDAADDVIRLGGVQQLEETDSSEDEATLNRVGDIPLAWYKDEEHFGYDVEGRKLMKSERSALERLLEETDDPNALRTIHDALHDEKKVLSNADLQLIFNLQRNRTTNSSYDMYSDVMQDTVHFDPLNHPLARGGGPSKMKFTPALHDMKVIAKMVKRLRQADEDKKNKPAEEKPAEEQILWNDGKVEMDLHTHFKYYNRIPKPKMAPPSTYESYRPPPEYLPSDRAKQRAMRLRAIDRKEHFLPQAFDALRHVPFYHHTIQDRYQRCLDLAFFPRAQRTRLVVDPNKLLPELPDPKDLRPFPERLSFHYKGHTATVRSLSVSPNGQYLATGCDDHLVRVFEVATGRLMKRYDLGAPVTQVEFCPSRGLNVLAAAVEYSLVFIVPAFAAHTVVNEHTVRWLKAPSAAALLGAEVAGPVGGAESLGGRGITQAALDTDELAHEATADLHDTEEREKRAEFVDAGARERRAGIVLKIALHAKVKRFTFHPKGDYLCALCPKDHVKYRQTVMLQLSKRKVFCPFRKFAEVVTDCKFHPREPIFFLSTTNAVRCYNLMAHKLQKRFKASGGITNCLSVHPEGDNFIVGDTTSHTMWFDCDFSDKPYKRMHSHKGVVNAVAFHSNTAAYPLFASGASDGQVHVFHGMVYDDYNKNALVVPVKILKHTRPVYGIAWHPTLPWIFTSTEDGTVTAWTE